MTTVLMQFGDGTHKEIEVEATEAADAVNEARDWVKDNAWFEVNDPDTGQDLANVPLD